MKARTLFSSTLIAGLATGLLMTTAAQAHDHDRDGYRGHDRHAEHYRGEGRGDWDHGNWDRDDRHRHEAWGYRHYGHYDGPYYSVRPYQYWPHYYPRRSYYGYGYPYGYRDGLDASVTLTVPLY